jgi:hypothetical protein
MLSRFSSLFTYVIVGLVISAAATPLNPLGDSLGDGTKSLSRPQSMMKSNDKVKPYGDDNKPYDDRRKSYDNDKDDRRKSYDNDKDDKRKSDDDYKRKSDNDYKRKSDNDKDDRRKSDDDDKDDKRKYGDDRSERHGQCSVENQHCCNQVSQVKHAYSPYPLICYRHIAPGVSDFQARVSRDSPVSLASLRIRTNSGASTVLQLSAASMRHATINKSVAKAITL